MAWRYTASYKAVTIETSYAHRRAPRRDVPAEPERSEATGAREIASGTKPRSDCEWIRSIISKPPDASLPQPKTGQDGITFWLKTPYAVVNLPDTEAKGMLLKYNKYTSGNPPQHTAKYRNTVNVLSAHSSPHLPKLYAHCEDPGDGHHYVLVEAISTRLLETPRDFQDCMDRAQAVVEGLVALDEQHHLSLIDVKKGQFMWKSSTPPYVVVYQDADDLVETPYSGRSPWAWLYNDQIEGAIQVVTNANPEMTFAEAHYAWHSRMFYNETMTIRYTMVLLRRLVWEGVGFDWRRQCQAGMPDRFLECLQRLMDWGATASDNWPSPRQFKTALSDCGAGGMFELERQAPREPAAWRDVQGFDAPAPHYRPPPQCHRGYDARSKSTKSEGLKPEWCVAQRPVEGMDPNRLKKEFPKECCRPKAARGDCYYRAPPSECGSQVSSA